MSGPQRSSAMPAWLIGAYIAMTAVVLYPIAAVNVPNLVDYPNHLARMYILSHIDGSDALRRFYEIRWRPTTYMAMDAAFLGLSRIAPIYQAGKVFVGLCVLLPVVSVAALHYVVHRRLSAVPIAAFLLSYNYILFYGFLNYLPVLCLAVLFFAGWIATADWPRWPRALLFCVPALALYFGHLVAFAAYCLLVGSFEIGRAWRTGFRPLPVVAADGIAAGLQIVPALALGLIVRTDRPFVGPLTTHFGTLAGKATAVVSPVLFMDHRVDVAIGAAAVLALIAGLLTGRLRLALVLLPSFVAICVVSLLIPAILLDVWGMDLRLPLLAAMLLVAAVSTTEKARPALKLGVLACVVLAVFARSVLITAHLRKADAAIAEFRRVIDAMPSGQRLITVDASNGRFVPGDPGLEVTPSVQSLAIIDRDAFVPSQFTGFGTLRTLPALRPLSSLSNNPAGVTLTALIDNYGRVDDPAVDVATPLGGRVYSWGWENKFDYVLLEHFGKRPAKLPGELELAASSDLADLYAIKRPTGGQRPSPTGD